MSPHHSQSSDLQDTTSEPTPDVLAREVAVEQAHVDQVYEALALATRSARQVADEGKRRFQTDRDDFLREEDGTALFERDAFAYQSARRLATLDAEHEGLVFGRLDLAGDDVRYIGRIGVRDEDYEPLVMDWRAPAAEPFYRATPQAPMDVIRRRVLRCRNDIVVGVEDDLLDSESDTGGLVIVGEGALMAALSRARSDAMRDIVATIQAEQDEAIRAPYQGLTTISGGPGTGKTVVALHRAAYLLYTHRRRFERGGVLVVGPSPVFMAYIERVLPSLGEDSVSLHAVGSVARDVLGFSAERVDTPTAATLKGSLRMLPVLKAIANEPLTGQLEPLRVSVKGEVVTLSTDELLRIRERVLEGRKINRAREAAESALLTALWTKYANEAELSRETYDDLASSSASFTMFMHAWWPSLEATEVLARLGERALLDRVAPRLSPDERDVLAASLSPDLIAPASGQRRGNWSVADMALLDELVSIIGLRDLDPTDDQPVFIEGADDVPELVSTADLLSVQREVDPEDDPQQTFAHVLVDEAQDITPMQWRMLRRRGPQASWTLVGDLAQSSYPHLDETRRAIDEVAGRGPRRLFRLSTNYRSPAEVFDLATHVISRVHPDADLPTAVRSTGIEPELTSTNGHGLVSTIAEHVTQLATQVEGTIGVLAPPSLIDQTRAGVDTSPAHERARVLTPLQSKGLEYDAVIVVSPDDIVDENPGRERVLYVALTRPTQRLVTIDLSERGPARWRDLL